MWVQRMIWLLGRMIFYMLLIPLLIGIVYTLSHDQWLAALIFMVLCVLVLYKGLIRLKIPANSLVVRDGKVVFFIPRRPFVTGSILHREDRPLSNCRTTACSTSPTS